MNQPHKPLVRPDADGRQNCRKARPGRYELRNAFRNPLRVILDNHPKPSGSRPVAQVGAPNSCRPQHLKGGQSNFLVSGISSPWVPVRDC